MYRCANCGEQFDEPKIKTHHYSGYNLPDGGYNEQYFSCPQCKCNEYEEIVICCECGDALSTDDKNQYIYFKELNEIVCNDCLHDYCKDHFS